MFNACTKRIDLGSKLKRSWVLTGDDWAVAGLKKGDTLVFSNTNFSIGRNGNRGAKNILGKWRVNETDSTLVLVFDLNTILSEIDSAVYRVSDNAPSVVFYSKGKELSRLDESGLKSRRTEQVLKIKSCTDQSLVISDGTGEAAFSYELPEQRVGMSFSSVFRGMIGILFLTGVLFLLSNNRKKISWKLVVSGILFQILFGVLVLKVPFVASLFDYVSNFFVEVLNYTRKGSEFVFGSLLDTKSYGFVFAFQILPTILFFSALTSILYYLGLLQKVVYGLSWLLGRIMKISGAENLSASANIFLGQTEAPLLIKPFLEGMTRSELLCVMVGGMATTAGGVMAAYVGFLGGDDPAQQLFFAKHLLASSIMSAPAAIVTAKMMIPQTEEVDSNLKVNNEKIGRNLLEAISNGTTEGLKLAVNVAAMLIVFIALTYMVNSILSTIGGFTGINNWLAGISNGRYTELNLQAIFAYPGSIIAWMLGVCKEDMLLVGQLLGEKTVINEFNAYITMGAMKAQNAFAEQKSVVMATYILSGFANFASIGIQIGGIGALAPGKRGMLSELGIKALIGGTVASLFTAAVVGMLIG